MPVESEPRGPAGPARGVLHAVSALGDGSGGEHVRVLPPAELAAYVAHFWFVRWALSEPFTAETLPHPSAHVLEEQDGVWRAEVAGVHTSRFVKQLAGRGRVFGIKFRPAMFQPLLRQPMARLTDRVVPIRNVFGAAADAWAHATQAEPELDKRITIARDFLAPLLPPPPHEVAHVRDLVERMATDRALLRVEDAASAIGLDVRALQRCFRRFVGASPKWVIRRYRLHEAAEQLKGEHAPSLAALAVSLGYADQAHFARDFRRVVGRTPRAFAASARRGPQ